MLSVVAIDELDSLFEDWRSDPSFAGIDAHPLTGRFGKSYYRELAGSGYVDTSFAVVEQSAPAVVVLCGVSDARLGYFGMPVRLFVRSNLSGGGLERVVVAAFRKIDDLILTHDVKRAQVVDFDSGVRLSLVGKQCLNRRGVATLHLAGICDLTSDDALLRRGLRKSYRSLINWGERNLTTKFVGRQNADYSLFRQYQALHQVVAGRVTRSQKSWDIMFEWIADGCGELTLGYLKSGELVAGTIVIDGADVAFYASGAYDRARFNSPISHGPLWIAIKRSAGRGRRLFDLGELPISAGDEKEADIAFFKRGFTDNFSTWVSWSWTVGL